MGMTLSGGNVTIQQSRAVLGDGGLWEWVALSVQSFGSVSLPFLPLLAAASGIQTVYRMSAALDRVCHMQEPSTQTT